MTFQRDQKSFSSSLQTPQTTSPFAPRPFAIQAQQIPGTLPTPEAMENLAFEQHKSEATGLEMKANGGTLAPEESDRLGVLQAKIDDFWVQRKEKASGFGHKLANISVTPPETRSPARIQPKLTIGQPGDKYEQEADTVARQVVQHIHGPNESRTVEISAKMLQRSGNGEPQGMLASKKSLMKKPDASELQQPVMPVAEKALQMKAPIQRQPIQETSDASSETIKSFGMQPENKTGLPDRLKAGIESLSGISMDDVSVHYNSSKPAQLQALAYAQGTDIHVGAGQEKHLPHEAWHVVQQKQGRVKPTVQAKGVAINDNQELEEEADVMGAKALQMKADPQKQSQLAASETIGNIIQRAVHADYASGLALAQRVKAMFEMATPDEQQAELAKLKNVAEPLKDSKATKLAKLAKVIAAGNVTILQSPRAAQIQSETAEVLSMAYEARDGGHSLDRHGPDISDKQLQHRLKTGYTPDRSFTPTLGLSTRFNKHEDYIKTRLAAVQGMKDAIRATRDRLKAELKAFHQAKENFRKSPPGPHKAAGQPLQLAIANTQAAVQAQVNAIGNPDATHMPVRFIPNAATPAGYITMYQSYSIIVDHGSSIGMGFRGKAANQVQINHPTNGTLVDAWTDWDKVDNLTKTRTGMDTGANHQELFGTDHNPENWTAFQHFPVDEPVGIQA